MARWIVAEVAQEKGFKSAYKLAMEAKLPLNTVRPIWNGTAKRLDLATLDRLAETLKVRPQDLIAEGEGNLEVEELLALDAVPA